MGAGMDINIMGQEFYFIVFKIFFFLALVRMLWADDRFGRLATSLGNVYPYLHII